MKKHYFLIFAILMAMVVSCSKVPAGHVGVKVYLLGTDKGVDSEELGLGRYWIGINEELYLFPTFKQNYVWTATPTEGSLNDESITFQTKEGLSVNADVGITYCIDATKVNYIFQKYRRGVEEITDTFLRNYVRDAFNMVASEIPVEDVYGTGKKKLLEKVNDKVAGDLKEEGILIERIYAIGDFRLPTKVVESLNKKIEAIQRAEQREYELREAEAEAKKKIAIARAEAEEIRLKTLSLTTLLVKYEAIKKWDGKMPTATGGALPFIDIGSISK